jgi:ArsR family transcriptional regulator, lead/cadmium/zinc/bismuth-responsive transcriptional repressor
MVAHTAHALPEMVSAVKVRAAREGLPISAVLREAAEVFRLLANPVRLSLMHALAHDELTVGDLARALDLSLSATSHQLALLRRMHLVASRDEGRFTYYRATDEFVGHLVHDCLAHAGETLGWQSGPHHHAHRVPRPRTT